MYFILCPEMNVYLAPNIKKCCMGLVYDSETMDQLPELHKKTWGGCTCSPYKIKEGKEDPFHRYLEYLINLKFDRSKYRIYGVKGQIFLFKHFEKSNEYYPEIKEPWIKQVYGDVEFDGAWFTKFLDINLVAFPSPADPTILEKLETLQQMIDEIYQQLGLTL